MADGSAADPFHVVVDSIETSATPLPVSQFGSWSVGQTGTWSVETTGTVGGSGETTSTVVVGGFSDDWAAQFHAMPSATLLLLGALLLVSVASLVLQVKR